MNGSDDLTDFDALKDELSCMNLGEDYGIIFLSKFYDTG